MLALFRFAAVAAVLGIVPVAEAQTLVGPAGSEVEVTGRDGLRYTGSLVALTDEEVVIRREQHDISLPLPTCAR